MYYSQKWDPKNKEFDPRFKEFGVAPKAKADYAFLLHELYHLEDDGIMTIVLPHGVLFRGGEEETIRKTLIERNHIEAIIGLPANIFFGTGIPTIIMVLKRTRSDSDILIIDASKKFEKVGKNNKLNMNVLFQSIEQIFKNAGIVNFEKLPADNAAIGKFAKEFNKFVNHLEAAIIQGFTWSKNSYPDEDQNEDAIKMLIDEQTYLTLLARYKEIY